MQRFRLTILLLILAELFSFCAFLYPIFNKICFLAIIALAVILSLEKLEYGIYLLLVELFIGSFGYLFFYETGGVKLSLRIGLFLAIFSVWSTKVIISKERRRSVLDGLKYNKFIRWYLLLFVFLIWGFINGLLRGNNFGDVFFDANSFFYFILIFPLSDVIKNKEQMNNIFSLLLAASAVIAAKSLFLLFIFSHKMHYAMEYLYTWMRDFRLGELTVMDGGFYRIFSQSHIYALIGLFFIILWLMGNSENNNEQEAGKKLRNLETCPACPTIWRELAEWIKKLFAEHNYLGFGDFVILSDAGAKNPVAKCAELWDSSLPPPPHLMRGMRGPFRMTKSDKITSPYLCGFFAYVLFLTVIILGMSRSFWVGGLAALIALYGWLVFVFYKSRKLRCQEISSPEKGSVPFGGGQTPSTSLTMRRRPDLKVLAKFTGALVLGFIISIILIFLIVKFPYPKETAYFSTDLFKDRALTVNDEAGSSRWNLLPVLTKEILKSPILGSGFGTVVTYKSGDPRVLSSSPDGEYTTYAFEWGYLDIILKIGLLGMFAYLWIVWKVWREGWDYLKSWVNAHNNISADKTRIPARLNGFSRAGGATRIKRGNTFFIAGLMLGLIVILATSIFSPYMNHPLGIGYILLATVITARCHCEE